MYFIKKPSRLIVMGYGGYSHISRRGFDKSFGSIKTNGEKITLSPLLKSNCAIDKVLANEVKLKVFELSKIKAKADLLSVQKFLSQNNIPIEKLLETR